MNIYELRRIIDREIVDFNQLNAVLQDYAHPRGKINRWLKTGELLRVKKGLYVFGLAARKHAYHVESLANLIYGPSAISLHYALSYYGLIPEAVHVITSITNKRHKTFNTPVGQFTYTYVHPKKYALGVQLQTLSDNTHFLIASPEKALCDTISLSINTPAIQNEDEMAAFLFDDLRIDEEGFRSLSFPLIEQIANCYDNPSLRQFVSYTRLWINKNA